MERRHGVFRKELRKKFNVLVESITGKKPDDNSNSPPSTYKEIKLKTIWIKKETNQIIKENFVSVFTNNQRVRTRFGVGLTVDWMLLPVGDYTVKVFALYDDPRFDGTFDIGLYSGYILK